MLLDILCSIHTVCVWYAPIPSIVLHVHTMFPRFPAKQICTPPIACGLEKPTPKPVCIVISENHIEVVKYK